LLAVSAAWVAHVGFFAATQEKEKEGISCPPWFADVTNEVRLSFDHDPGELGAYFMPQIMGSGCALLDVDGDGRLDIYLIHNGGTKGRKNQLFRQKADGTFEDISAGSGLDVAGFGMGVAVGDVNNDGRPDVLLTEYGRTRLFLNRGQGRFVDISRQAGIDNPLWGTSCAFFDYDRDGWLDLVVVNYVVYDPTRECGTMAGQRDYCHPKAFQDSPVRLYRNCGPVTGAGANAADPVSVRFADVTVPSGLARAPGPGLGVLCADFTGDGWPDIFVANDSKPNHLWVNQGNGTFTEEALRRGLAYNGMGQPQADMGVAVGDVNGDGLFDLFDTHLTEQHHALWLQGPRGFFQDRTGQAGLASPDWRGTGFGTILADFDNDGALDLAIVNGRVSYSPHRPRGGTAFSWKPYAERNQLFVNDGTGHFTDVSAFNEAFCGEPGIGRGLACGDIDGDGALDLLVSNIATPARLYRNVAKGRGHWLLVRVVDPALGGRDAYGAEVTVVAGNRRWLRLINPGHSYLSSNDSRAHFGLGDHRSVDAIRVVWPDGSEEEFADRQADQAVVLQKGRGRSVTKAANK
jgi:hypothetical protein